MPTDTFTPQAAPTTRTLGLALQDCDPFYERASFTLKYSGGRCWLRMTDADYREPWHEVSKGLARSLTHDRWEPWNSVSTPERLTWIGGVL
jgi:hypothetical protein